MRLQQLTYSCGPAAIRNGASLLNVHVTEHTIRELAEITKEGTDSHQMLAAIRGIGLHAAEYQSDNKHHAWRWLHGTIIQGSVPLLCVDQYGHWVTVVGLLGQEVVTIFDPQRTVRNKREHGVHPLHKDKLMRRWRHARYRDDCPIYAICMSKP